MPLEGGELRVSGETLLLACQHSLQRGYGTIAVTGDLIANRDRLSADERRRVRENTANALTNGARVMTVREVERWREVAAVMT